MSTLRNYVLKQVAEGSLNRQEAEGILTELRSLPKAEEDSVAIIGMAGKFPKSPNLSDFWRNLMEGNNCISEFPEQRKKDSSLIFDNPHYFEFLFDGEPPVVTEDRKNHARAGYLDEVDKFDAAFFGIPPREALYMDPLQRLFLETAWESIEDAGYGGAQTIGSRTGVFVGRDNTCTALYKYLTEADPMHLTGTWEGILASRISYIFNFKGPAMVIDTACSSGLVSVHLACQAIRNKECDMAIAGGIAHSFGGYFAHGKGSMDLGSVESKNYQIRTFDKDADGTVWGEGVGVLFLKPLKKALEDGDNIHALIRGSAINNDGSSNGITAPSVSAQEDVIQRAWNKAGINPETIQYVEAHGTGTVLGDPIEIKGLSNVFRTYTDKKQFCGIGSLKTNMGHMVGASGVASLLKVVLALKNRKLPPSRNFDNPNPYINFAESPLYVNDRLRDWKRNEAPRRAGVSSFGFSGTNCHVIVEEAPERVPLPDGPVHILALSAKTEAGVKALVRSYLDYCNNVTDLSLEDLCYTANTGRGHYTHRLALVFNHREELIERLETAEKTDFRWILGNGIFYSEHRTVPDTKVDRKSGEITDNEKGTHGRIATDLLLKTKGGALTEQTLMEVSNLYVRGAEVNWNLFYEGEGRLKISLPIYPFERIRYWANPKKSTIKNHSEVLEYIHPLVQRCVAETKDQQIYETEFSMQDHWVLSDHKIMGHYVLPGTTYVEIARVVGFRYFRTNQLEIRDLFYMSPLVVKENEKKCMQIIVTKEKNHLKCVMASREGGSTQNESWVVHAEGYIGQWSGEPPADVDIPALLAQAGEKPETINFDSDPHVFTFGPRWDNVKNLFFTKGNILIELGLLDTLRQDVNTFQIHPGLLDNAVNSTSQSIGEGTYLPLTYKSFKLYSNLPSSLYSFVRQKPGKTENGEVFTFDITLCDQSGRVLAEISNYSIKKAKEINKQFNKLITDKVDFYQMCWKPESLVSNSLDSGCVVLLHQPQDSLSQEVAVKLGRQGIEVISVISGTSYTKYNDNEYSVGWSHQDIECLLTELEHRQVTHFVHMVHCRSKLEEIIDAASFDHRQQQSVMWLFYTVKTLLQQKRSSDVRIVLVADSINQVNGKEPVLNPYSKSMFGLGKAIIQEYGNINCRALDIDDSVTAEIVVDELASVSTAYEAAYRNGMRYVEELAALQLPDEPEALQQLKNEGCYVITGGTGGLGLEIADYLADKGNINIALVSRSSFPGRDHWNSIIEQPGADKKQAHIIRMIRQIERKGAVITLVQSDVTDYSGISASLEALRNRFGAIHGLIHCAGVAGDGFILRKEEYVFRGVLDPKVKGAWNLEQLTRNDTLQFFLLFSSVTSLTGGAGQGDYTAANAFLDAFAERMRKKGINAKAINWPAWKEVGMAADYEVKEEYLNFRFIEREQAFQVMDLIINAPVARITPALINFPVLIRNQAALPFALSAALEDHMNTLKRSGTVWAADNSVSPIFAKVDLIGKSNADYSETEHIIGTIFGQVLGLEEVDVYESFNSMGGDSILATHLLKAIDNVMPNILDISDIFTYSSVIQMSDYINRKTSGNQAARSNSELQNNRSEQELSNLLDDMETGKLSVEDALKSLLN
ncbi:SDR family NAD(P)-dependent oxidoreductase [Paenibacillus graminis]|uniref:Uncharacterized protein n=1 Tax=Paenibacillus graminis TaxID=189425 RepID=A0A089NCZ9_9BACL|nr:SDR family NAD(P)-dependent oxidoreductase [Paenibacillus graminis]AIQ66839.1 hypothetical protein PGRAT_03650 [Paenibacillus graminis]